MTVHYANMDSIPHRLGVDHQKANLGIFWQIMVDLPFAVRCVDAAR
jgi:hypothetical protein